MNQSTSNALVAESINTTDGYLHYTGRSFAIDGGASAEEIIEIADTIWDTWSTLTVYSDRSSTVLSK
jgi:hypothetical protein